MVITRTPFRMSFFGGGTDMPEFFRENGGAVISTTFDKYCYVTVRHLPPFFSYRTELSYSKIERVTEAEELEHPAVRNAMKLLRMRDLRITYEADLPARSGLGTSSSFAVGMLSAFHGLKGHAETKERLADEAIYLEREMCREAGGWQDQIAASFGGFNKIVFGKEAEDIKKSRKQSAFEKGQTEEKETIDYDYAVIPLSVSEERKRALNANLMMFFTGFTRFSSDIQKENARADGREKTLQLKKMLSLVPAAEKILTDDSTDLDDFGRLLNETWRLKRQTGGAVTTGGIDALYEKGLAAGALGGKLLGAGGGGFMVFYVPKEKHHDVMKAMNELMYVPFEFESEGTKTLYSVPETYEIREVFS